MAARAGVPLEEYLQHRLSRQLAALPVPAGRLPSEIAIEPDGTFSVRPGPPESERRAPWLASFLRAEGRAAVSADIDMAQARAARAAVRIDAQRQRVDAAASGLEAVTAGNEIADPADEAQALQMGRPPVPAPLGLALRGGALALVAAETWQLALPCFAAAGVRTADLAAELHRDPVALGFGVLFALGASLSLFLFAHFALTRALDVLEAQPAARRRAFAAAGAVAATAVAAAMAWSVAGARSGAADALDPRYTRAVVFLVVLAIPVTVAWLLAVARRHDAARDAALRDAAAWDREHYRALAEVSRHAAALAEEQRRLADLEAERDAALRQLQALQRRAALAERLAADAADAEEADLARLVQAVAAGLELDRYAYLRAADAHAGALAPEPRAAAAPQIASTDVGRNLGLTG
jgi:hypothetical protein